MKSWLVFYICMVILIDGIAARNINEDGGYVPVQAHPNDRGCTKIFYCRGNPSIN